MYRLCGGGHYQQKKFNKLRNVSAKLPPKIKHGDNLEAKRRVRRDSMRELWAALSLYCMHDQKPIRERDRRTEQKCGEKSPATPCFSYVTETR